MKTTKLRLSVCALLLAVLCSFAALAADADLMLSVSAPITSDSGICVITPSLSVGGKTVTDFDGIHYSLDSVCAKPEIKDDGTLTLSGRVNGSVNVGAAITIDGITYTAAPVTVPVSGQYDRISAKKIKLMVFGNSITSHPSLDDWTSQGQGMAADSPAKDYVHVLAAQLENKYGKGNVSITIKTAVDFERAMDTATTTTDWTSFLSSKANDVAAAQPDIIVLQMGENSFTSNVPGDWRNVYKHGIESFVNIMREKAPNATVLLVSSTWGGTIDSVVAVAESQNVPYVRSDLIKQMEGSMAKDDNYHGVNSSIGSHPGNIGHERIGLACYESVNYYLTDSIDAVLPYSAYPESLTISGDTVIVSDGGSAALSAPVLPAEAAQDVIWTSSDKRIATVDENGTVFAKNNGTVTITAMSAFDENIKDTHTITVSGQSEPFTLSFDKNTTDTVTDMPEADHYAKGYTPMPSVYPERKTYTFLGWSLSPDGETTDSITVTGNTVVYAVWEKASAWYFNRPDNIDVRDGLNYVDGFTTNAFHAEVENGLFTFMTTDPEHSGKVFSVNSPVLDLDADEYAALVIKQKNIAAANSTLKMTIYTTAGEYDYEKVIPDTNYNEYVFDLSETEGTITGFVFYPTNLDTTVYIDSIEFVSKKQGTVLHFDGSEYAGFSVDTEPVDATDGTDYLIRAGKTILLYSKDYSENVMYRVTEQGFEAPDYYVVYNDMGYGSVALDGSIPAGANVFVAFYMPSGKIRKAIIASDIIDGRAYFKTPNVFETVYAKAFILDAGSLKPLTVAKTLPLYDVVSIGKVDENGDTPIDMQRLFDTEPEVLLDGEDLFH